MASKKLNLKPLGDRLVVEPMEKEERTASGIILPETAKEKPQEGTVLAAGPGLLTMKALPLLHRLNPQELRLRPGRGGKRAP